MNYDFYIEKTKDECNIIKINKNNKWIYIGSKYNYKREIDKFIEQIGGNLKKDDVIFIFGMATGEHVMKIAEKYYETNIILFEPNIKLASYIKKNLTIYKNVHIEEYKRDNIIKNLKKYINEYNYKNSQYVYFCNYDKIYYDEYNEYCDIINGYIRKIALDCNTKKNFSKIWFTNLLKSIPQMLRSVPADLYDGKFKNKPAVIVSAGPSLSKNIELLKAVNNKTFILVNGRTLGACIRKSIKPDLLVIADANDANYKFVKEYMNNDDIPLLFYEGGNIRITEEYKGKKIFFSYNNIIYNIFERRMTPIYTGGSVAHAMTSYAVNLGCNPIIFIGQDFAYTDDKFHSELAEIGTSLKFNDVKNESDFYVKGTCEEKVRTNLVMDDYRKSMEKIIKMYSKVKFIDATEGGAFIEGTEVMTLNNAIKKYCNESFSKMENINIDNKKYIKNATNQLKELKKISEKFLDLDDCDKFLDLAHEVFNNNQVYNLLLYSEFYEYFSTSNYKPQNVKKEELYINTKKSIEYANKLICDVAEMVKNNV